MLQPTAHYALKVLDTVMQSAIHLL